MSTSKKISLVTVTYNSEKTIFKLLKSLKIIDKFIKEIIIIDNNSKKFDENKLKSTSTKIKIIKNKNNLGFSKATNQGIKKAESDFVLLLNPDTYLENDSIKNIIYTIYKTPKVGAIGGKILNDKNQTAYTATNKPSFLIGLFEFTNLKKIFPNNKYSKIFWIEKNKQIDKPIKVTSLCGAFMLIRKEINNTLNLFNEDYFLYLEDIDFGIRINNKKHFVIFDPRSEIKHIGGSSTNNKYKTDLNSWYKSRKIFFKSHLNKTEGIILSIVFSIEEKILKLIQFIKNETP